MTSLYSNALEVNSGRSFSRRPSYRKRMHRLPHVPGNRCRSGLRFGAAKRNRQILSFTNEIQAGLTVIPIDADHVPDMYLIGSKEIGKRIDNVALNRQLETLRAIALFRTFPSKNSLAGTVR
jgi:hypothetical protein